MVHYNEARTVFYSEMSFKWYILPAGEKKSRWWKRYVEVPRISGYWCEYMTPEERDKLLEIYEADGITSVAEACEYLVPIWFGRKREYERERKARGRERLEG